MAGALDQDMSFASRVARTVDPLVDKCPSMNAAHHARSFGEDYQLLRTRVLGLHYEGQTATSHTDSSMRKGMP